MSMKNSETIGNRTRDLLACKAAPQITAQFRYVGISIFRLDIYHEQYPLSNNRYVRRLRILLLRFQGK